MLLVGLDLIFVIDLKLHMWIINPYHGPLLFNMYVKDLPKCLATCEIVMYAVDTILY